MVTPNLHACIGSACATVYPLTVELFVVSSFSQFSSNNVVHISYVRIVVSVDSG